MLAAVLGVLKVIICALGVLLAVFALVCALALFVPISYHMEDGVAGRPRGTWEFSWLCRFLRVFYSYGGVESVGRVVVKVLGFTLGRRKKARKAEPSPAERKRSAPQREPDADETEPPELDEDETKEEPPLRKFAIFHKIKRLYNDVMFVVQYPQRKEILSLTVTYAKKIWRALKPDSFRVRGEVGLGDPAQTGMALGMMSVVSAFLELDVRISGNFEKAVLTIDTKADGKITLFSLLLPTVRYVFARPVWKVVRPVLFRKGDLG